MNPLRYESIATDKEVGEYLYPTFWYELKDYFFYFLKVFVVVGVASIIVKTSIFDLISIEGQSMAPNYNAKPGTSDQIYINKLSPKFSSIKRGQVVVLISPTLCRQEKTLYIKRIIGLPGERLKFANGKVYIINEKYAGEGIELDESSYLKPEVKTYKKISSIDSDTTIEKILGNNEYFFMGDNRTGSQDSRVCGPITKEQILGEEIFRFTPESSRQFFKAPKYEIGSQ
jgi:signal peptidase I